MRRRCTNRDREAWEEDAPERRRVVVGGSTGDAEGGEETPRHRVGAMLAAPLRVSDPPVYSVRPILYTAPYCIQRRHIRVYTLLFLPLAAAQEIRPVSAAVSLLV